MQVEIGPYIVRWKQIQKERQESLKRRHDSAWSLAAKAAEFLRKNFDVSKIVVFGSVAQSELFHPVSDVDLAVWGLNPGVYFRAVGQLQALDPQISVDLIMFEEASESLQRAIIEGGVEI